MKLRFLGTSDAVNSDGRANGSYLLEGMQNVLVDCGPTTLQRMKIMGVRPTKIETIVVTHLHGDHFGGLPSLFIDWLFTDIRDAPLTIVGPKGTKSRVESLARTAFGDAIDHQWPFVMTILECDPGHVVKLSGLEITAFPAVHMRAPDQALCLRFQFDHGPIVAFSGDTGWCPSVVECSKGADCFVAECTSVVPGWEGHMSVAQWRDTILPQIQAKIVRLSHLGPGVRDALKMERSLKELMTDDGMEVDLA